MAQNETEIISGLNEFESLVESLKSRISKLEDSELFYSTPYGGQFIEQQVSNAQKFLNQDNFTMKQKKEDFEEFFQPNAEKRRNNEVEKKDETLFLEEEFPLNFDRFDHSFTSIRPGMYSLSSVKLDNKSSKNKKRRIKTKRNRKRKGKNIKKVNTLVFSNDNKKKTKRS